MKNKKKFVIMVVVLVIIILVACILLTKCESTNTLPEDISTETNIEQHEEVNVEDAQTNEQPEEVDPSLETNTPKTIEIEPIIDEFGDLEYLTIDDLLD